jgi:two-component system CheB/CheR fusion protein
MFPPAGTTPQLEQHRSNINDGIVDGVRRTGAILVIDDDPAVREFLNILLKDEGHRTVTAPDGITALELVARGIIRPDLILVDYNLPNGLNGVQLSAKLREKLYHELPVIILTGDIATSTLRDIADHDCVQLNKPVKPKELMQVIQRYLPISHAAAHPRPPLPAEAAHGLDDPAWSAGKDGGNQCQLERRNGCRPTARSRRETGGTP